MIVPGAGQLLAKRWWRGAAMLAVTAALVTAAAVATTGGAAPLASLLVRPDALVALLAGNVALAVFRLAAAVDAFRLVIGGHLAGVGQRLAAGIVVIALAAATAAPHAVATNYGWRVHELLTTVFVADQGSPEQSMPPATTSASQPPAPGPDDVPPAADAGAAPSGRVEVDIDVHHEFPWQEHDRFTLALLGSDAGPGRSGARADALLVVTVEPSTGATAAVSIPRNLQGYPLPAGLEDITAVCPSDQGYEQISGLYACLTHPRYARDAVAGHYAGARDPAARGVADTLGVLLDQPVDHYAVVDLGGFVDVVDALGGVTVHVPRTIRHPLSPPRAGDDWQTYHLPAGEQHLDGARALAFVRSRTGTSDYDRMRRQRCLVGALAEQTGTGDLVQALPDLVDVMTERVRTDVPVDALPPLIEVVGSADISTMGSLGLNPPEFQAADRSPRLDEIRHAVHELFDDPASAADDVAAVAAAGQVCS